MSSAARSMWKRRRILLFAGIIIAVSIGIVAVGVPIVPNPPQTGTLQTAITQNVQGARPDRPGFSDLTLPNVQAGQPFVLSVTVSGGNASFCVLPDQIFQQWVTVKSGTGSTFPWQSCKAERQQTVQTTLTFTPDTSGTWDVVVLNTNSSPVTVLFSPA